MKTDYPLRHVPQGCERGGNAKPTGHWPPADAGFAPGERLSASYASTTVQQGFGNQCEEIGNEPRAIGFLFRDKANRRTLAAPQPNIALATLNGAHQ